MNEFEQCISEWADRVADRDKTISQLQARCREMERDRCGDCGSSLINQCLACGAPVCCPKCCQVDQLQATLAAREVEVDRLKLAQQHSIQDECEAEQRLIDAGISDYEDGGQGEYRGLLTQIDLCIKERDAAVQDAQRYRYLRAHAAFDGSYKHRITWYLPRCYQDAPAKDQLDKDIDEMIKRHSFR